MMFGNPKKILNQFGIASGMVIADFGSGSGSYTHELLSQTAPNGIVYAIDIQRSLLQRLLENFQDSSSQLITVHADLEQQRSTQLNDNTADVVIMANILSMVTSPQAVLTEASRILRPKGRMFIIDNTNHTEDIGKQVKQLISHEKLLVEHEEQLLEGAFIYLCRKVLE